MQDNVKTFMKDDGVPKLFGAYGHQVCAMLRRLGNLGLCALFAANTLYITRLYNSSTVWCAGVHWPALYGTDSALAYIWSTIAIGAKKVWDAIIFHQCF